MRRRRRRISRSNPLPPYGRFYSVDSLVLLCKNPFHMICVVLCYGQHAAHQPLARVGQTAGVRMAGMVLGGVTFDVLNEPPAGAAKGGRWRAVVSCVVGAVTNPIPYCRTRVFARCFRPLLSRTHAPHTPSHDHDSRASSELHALARHARTFLCLSLLFCCYVIPAR